MKFIYYVTNIIEGVISCMQSEGLLRFVRIHHLEPSPASHMLRMGDTCLNIAHDLFLLTHRNFSSSKILSER